MYTGAQGERPSNVDEHVLLDDICITESKTYIGIIRCITESKCA